MHCFIWREQTTHDHLLDIREKVLRGGGSVCVCDGISLGGRMHLHLFPHITVNIHICIHHILDAYVCLYVIAICNYLLL